ncbi:MAG: LacI family transcriptional regulator [Chloroflexi bacterium]|nr:LacI family transcriptional regulator [Chloroflexota bacterium]
MSPTIKDIARELGLDSSTVSLALRNQTRISLATRLRVQEVARQLGYVPNRAAQTLRQGRSRTLSLVLWGNPTTLLPETFAETALSVTNAAFHSDYAVLVWQATEERLLTTPLARFPELRQTDGAVFVGETADREGLAELVRTGYPLIHLGERYLDGVDLPFVSGNFVQGGALAAEHLSRNGHRRMAVLCGRHKHIPEIPARRLAGFARVAGDRLVAAIDVDIGEELDTIVPQIRELGVTAVFSTEPHVALSLLSACRREGVAVPEDLSIVAFDSPPELALTNPPLTCIYQPRDHVGERAVELLAVAIEKGVPVQRSEVFPCTLIERGSVAPPRERTEP